MLNFSKAAMPTNRQNHMCGLVKDLEGNPEIVVAGGYFNDNYLSSVDIYIVNTDSWRGGNITKIFSQNL